MTRIRDVYAYLCELAPLELQMEFDNSGFQIGHGERELTSVLLALDVTDEVVREAAQSGAELIISHHPLLFHPPRRLVDDDPASARILTLIEQGIAVISMHTNLDIAADGVNDVLIRLLGAEPETALDAEGCGRIGTLPEALQMEAFLERCRTRLHGNGLRYVSAGKAVKRLAVMGGAGGDALEDAFAKGCDTYVSADLKYHCFQRAQELGMNLIDADHFCTEQPMIPVLCDRLSQRFPELRFTVSRRHGPLIQFA